MSSAPPPRLKLLSQSAQNSGLAPHIEVGTTVQPCPYGRGARKGQINSAVPKAKEPSYEYCDLKQLDIALQAPDKSASLKIDRVRRNEPVGRSVAARYRQELRGVDIVIEALADIPSTTGAFASADRKLAKGNRPMSVQAKSTDKCRHNSFSPPHPYTSLELMDGSVQETDGGASVQGSYFSVRPLSPDQAALGFLWAPFSIDRTKRYVIAGESCGNLPTGNLPTGWLAAALYVIPYEEWQVTLGIGPAKSGSYKKEWNFKAVQDGDSGRKVVSKTTIAKQSGGSQETTTTEKMETATGQGRTRTTTETKEATGKGSLAYDIIGPESASIKTVKQSWDKKPKKTVEAPEREYRKVKIKHKIAGQEVETDLNDEIEKIFKCKELIDKMKSVFDMLKFGASFSIEYELLAGELTLGLGNQWPTAYCEDERVYYVQHYIEAGGSVDFFSAKITGFCGLAVKSPFALIDAAIEIGGYLSASVKINVSVNGQYAWTKETSEYKVKVEGTVPFKLEPGFKANGRALGYSVDGKVAVEADVSAGVEGEFTNTKPFFLRSSFIFGSETEDSSEAKPDYDAVRLVAELKLVGSSVRTWKIKPYGMMKGGVVWKDYYLVGKEQKT